MQRVSTRRVPIHQLIHCDHEIQPSPAAGNAGSSLAAQQQPLIPSNGHGLNGRIPVVHRFTENGREYYAYLNEVTYPFPSDDDEFDRLDCLHELMHGIALNKKLISAELDTRVPYRMQFLDVGYGTGVWSLNVADKNPNIDIHGIDLIGNQPVDFEVGPNVFLHSPVDFGQPHWGFSESFFDLIHMSQLCGSVMDWPQLYRDAARHLRPGTGHIEHIEVDWAPRSAERDGVPHALQTWWAHMAQASAMVRRPIAYRDDTEELLFNAGFIDIVHKTIRIPIQAGKQDARGETLRRWFIGIMCGESKAPKHVRPRFEALSMSLLTRVLRFRPDQVKELCSDVRSCYYTQPSQFYPQFYHNIHVWTARKPMG